MQGKKIFLTQFNEVDSAPIVLPYPLYLSMLNFFEDELGFDLGKFLADCCPTCEARLIEAKPFWEYSKLALDYTGKWSLAGFALKRRKLDFRKLFVPITKEATDEKIITHKDIQNFCREFHSWLLEGTKLIGFSVSDTHCSHPNWTGFKWILSQSVNSVSSKSNSLLNVCS